MGSAGSSHRPFFSRLYKGFSGLVRYDFCHDKCKARTGCSVQNATEAVHVRHMPPMPRQQTLGIDL